MPWTFDTDESRTVSYPSEHGTLVFLPKCECGRYVRADAVVRVNGLGELAKAPNATCSRCGRVEMYFQGFF